IEREMTHEDTAVNTRAIPLAPKSRPPRARPSTVGLHETTRQAVHPDPTRPDRLRRLGAQVSAPQLDLQFDISPTPATIAGPALAGLVNQGAGKGPEPEAVVRWHPLLEAELGQDGLAHDPELDEAAMAFANADFGGCEKALRAMVAAGGPRQKHAPTWRALLDLYRAIGQQQRFEWTCAQFVRELGETPPTWVSIPRLAMNMDGRSDGGTKAAQVAHSPAASAVTASTAGASAAQAGSGEAEPWRSPVRLDAPAIRSLQSHVRGAAGRAIIDWGPLQMLDVQGAQALRTLLRDWTGSATPLQWRSVEALFDLLEIAAPPGDHLADPAFWQVRLEALRLLGVQSAYDLAAEDFAATYGSTPPEWVPPACVVSTSDDPHAEPMQARTDLSVSTLPDELGANSSVTVELVGQLAGDVSATMSKTLSEMGDATPVTVACDRLIRVDLMAAGELTNWVSARRAEGRLVRFTQVHRLVALFFCAMGLDDQAPIELRSS
ncbi:MAG: hypothetical protein ACKOD9_10205, partial [Rubrivivax sp.]